MAKWKNEENKSETFLNYVSKYFAMLTDSIESKEVRFYYIVVELSLCAVHQWNSVYFFSAIVFISNIRVKHQASVEKQSMLKHDSVLVHSVRGKKMSVSHFCYAR